MDEVLQFLLVLIGVPIRRIAQHAPLLGEVLEGRARVPSGAKTELPRGLGSRERTSPTQKVEELRRQERDPCLAYAECGQLQAYRGKQGSVQLAHRLEEPGQGLHTRSSDGVSAGRAALGRKDHRRHAVVAVDELKRGIVTRYRRHHLQVAVPRQ